MTDKLSGNDISVVITLGHLSRNIEELIQEDISPGERKNLKYVNTYLQKYFKCMRERIDDDSVKRLTRKLHTYVPVLTPISETKHVILDRDDFLDLSEVILDERCKGCKGIKNCAIEKAFHENFIPELKIIGKENRYCPYMWNEEDMYDTVEIMQKSDPGLVKRVRSRQSRAERKREKAKQKRK